MSVLPYESPTADVARAAPPWLTLLKKLGPLMGLVFVFLLFTILRPARFTNPANLEVMLLQTAVVATAALGMTLIIISGGIDLSAGSNIAICSVVVAMLLRAGLNPVLAALGGIATGAVCGATIGSLITALRVVPFIITLGMLGILRGVAKGLADEKTVSPGHDTWLNQLLVAVGPDQRWMILPPGVWITILLALVVAGMLRYTRLGRHIFAIGSNEQTARLCGVNVGRTRVAVYALGGALFGVAGVLQFSYLTLGDPTSAMGYELNVIAAVVIGGASLVGGEGGVSGTIIGALIMTVVSNGCQKMDMPNYRQEVVTGCIIVAAAALDALRHRRT